MARHSAGLVGPVDGVGLAVSGETLGVGEYVAAGGVGGLSWHPMVASTQKAVKPIAKRNRKPCRQGSIAEVSNIVQCSILCYPIAMGCGLGHKLGSRGMALVASLFISVLILVLGMSLLTASQHDLAFQRQQQARDEADLLARSGLEFCLFRLNQNPPALDDLLTVDVAQTFQVNGSTEYFTLERRGETPSGPYVLIVEGVVRKANGELLASRTIAVPYGPDNLLTEAEVKTQAYDK